MNSRIAASRPAGSVPASRASHARSGHVSRERALGRSRSATASWSRSIKISASFHHDSRRDKPSSDTARDHQKDQLQAHKPKIIPSPDRHRTSARRRTPSRASPSICPGGAGLRHPQVWPGPCRLRRRALPGSLFFLSRPGPRCGLCHNHAGAAAGRKRVPGRRCRRLGRSRTQGVMARARRSRTASRDRPTSSIRLAVDHNSAGSSAHSCSTTVT